MTWKTKKVNLSDRISVRQAITRLRIRRRGKWHNQLNIWNECIPYSVPSGDQTNSYKSKNNFHKMTQHLLKQRPRLIDRLRFSVMWLLITIPEASVEVFRKISKRDLSWRADTALLWVDKLRTGSWTLLFISNGSVVASTELALFTSVLPFSFCSYSSMSGSGSGECDSILSGVYGSYRLPLSPSAVFRLKKCVSTRFTIISFDNVKRFEISVFRCSVGCCLIIFWHRGHIEPIIDSCSASTLSQLAYNEHMQTFKFSVSVTLILTVGLTGFFWFGWFGSVFGIWFAAFVELISHNLLFNLLHSNNTLQYSLLAYGHWSANL